MAWELTTVTVALDPNDSTQVIFTVGPEGFTVPRDQVKQIAAGNGKSIEALIAFIGITAARAGADISTPAKAKAYIESRQWPW